MWVKIACHPYTFRWLELLSTSEGLKDFEFSFLESQKKENTTYDFLPKPYDFGIYILSMYRWVNNRQFNQSSFFKYLYHDTNMQATFYSNLLNIQGICYFQLS